MERAYGLEIPANLEEACTPARTALLVYDMQVGIIRQIKNGAEIVGRVTQVVDAARRAGMRIVFMRHMSLPREMMGVFQLRMAMAWQRVATVAELKPGFLRDSPISQLVPEITPRSDEAILDKFTMSAFEGTPLDIVLRDCGINSFLIIGVAMEIGIEPTVRHGSDLGYIPIVVVDACGAGQADAAERSIATMKFVGDAIMTDVETVVAILDRSQRTR